MAGKKYFEMTNTELACALETVVEEKFDRNILNIPELELPTNDRTFFQESYWAQVRDAYENLAINNASSIPEMLQIYSILNKREKDYKLSLIDGC